MKVTCTFLLLVSLAIGMLAAVEGQSQFAFADAQARAIDGGQSRAFAQAMAFALTGNDNDYYDYMLYGMKQGIRRYGCDYYQTVIAQARAIAIADGNGNVFAQACTSVEVIDRCWKQYGFGFGSGRKLLSMA